MLKIIEVVRGLGLGGAETLLFRRLKHSIEAGILAPADITVINTYPRQDYYEKQFRALGVSVLNTKSNSRILSSIELVRYLGSQGKEAVLVAHSPFPASIVKAQSACRGARFPIIEVAHSTQYSWLTLSLGLVWNRYADLCIAVSDDVSRAVTTRGFRRKLVILAGVDQAEMRLWVEGSLDVALGMRESLGVKSSQRLIVAVGSLVALKGHRFLLDAVAELRDSNIHAAIVGEGDERASLEQQISRLGLVGRVHLLGRQADAWQWAAVADIIAHPSLYEGLPVALMEARVLGIPTVASDVGGIAQLFDGASASRLTAPESSADLERAIREVLDDLPLFAEEFLTRASGPTRWDISRYSREFYAALASESIKFASRSQDRN